MAELHGLIEFFERVRRLMDSDVATKTLRKGVMSGLKVMGQQQKALAPVERAKTPPRRWRVPAYTGEYRYAQPGRLSAATGRAAFSRGTGRKAAQKRIIAKAGINVAVKRGPKSAPPLYPYSPHGHLVALGTKMRYTKRGARRGIMPSNSFIRRASAAKATEAQEKVREVLKADWDRILDAGRRG